MHLLNSHSSKEDTFPQQSSSSHKLRVADRIELLTDANSFFELNSQVHDGVVTGIATINGRTVALYAQDFSFKGGSVGTQHAHKICDLMDHAAHIGCPLIGLIDSGGARIQEGVEALAGYGKIFKRNSRYSGIIPQISVILGPCAGGAAYSPALTDLIFTVRGISNLFITGPQVVEQVTGEKISKEALGGADIHTQRSGVAHFISDDEHDCLALVRRVLDYLPSNYKSMPTIADHATQQHTDLSSLVPVEHERAYDIATVIAALVDDESWCAVSDAFAPNMVTGFAHLEGQSIGIIANQPLVRAGAIDSNASCKAARFIQLCNSFDIPIVSLVDVPGYLPGVEQEHTGIIRHGAKLLTAYAQATVPLLTVILRKAFGGAYIVMGSKHLGADWVAAWPSAQIAVLGAQTAVQIIHRKQLIDDTTGSKRAAYEEAYAHEHLNINRATQAGYVDAIITPKETREQLVRALSIFRNKVVHLPKKKASNNPL